jgi:hypothetical protein
MLTSVGGRLSKVNELAAVTLGVYCVCVCGGGVEFGLGYCWTFLILS